MPKKVILVIPCYNEERRFDAARFAPLLSDGTVELLLVNDGSTDGTLSRLRAMADKASGRCRVLDIQPNAGKGEAVRRGMLRALADGADVVGYLDADGATSADEMLGLIGALAREDKDVVLGARVALAGHRIARHPVRHYMGRVFATCAALTLGCAIYDTQCGAKLFRTTPALVDALQRPFRGRWAFDVDLLGRLLWPETVGTAACPVAAWLEVPLKAWRDEPGSKLRASAMLGMGWELLGIWVALRRRRRLRVQPLGIGTVG